MRSSTLMVRSASSRVSNHQATTRAAVGFQAVILRLPPTPAPRLAVEGEAWPPSRVWTANFSASELDFRIEVATCIWVFPAWAERIPLTIAIMSIRNTPEHEETLAQG